MMTINYHLFHNTHTGFLAEPQETKQRLYDCLVVCCFIRKLIVKRWRKEHECWYWISLCTSCGMLLYKKVNCEKGREGEEKSMNVLLTEMCLHVLWYVVVRENREQSHHYTQNRQVLAQSHVKLAAVWCGGGGRGSSTSTCGGGGRNPFEELKLRIERLFAFCEWKRKGWPDIPMQNYRIESWTREEGRERQRAQKKDIIIFIAYNH